MKSILAAGLCLLTVGMAVGCKSAPATVKYAEGINIGLFVPLNWENPGDIVAKPINNKVPVSVTLTDARTDKVLVGHSAENTLYVGTKADMVKAYSLPVAKLFGSAGFNIQPENAKTVVSITVNKLYVEEDSTYKGEVLATVEILRDGKSVWSGSAVGHSTRWGRSYKDSNYDECLTNTMVDLVDKLTDNADFLQSLSKGAAE